ncbi:MAG: efflux RND transporter periplasmic adaptor subunit [Candidatus Melainabacteria bacterium]|nr:efflux RND transporter periplasmic adaptor subunit [Candidatus Melainabacteria bacterium]
MQQKTITPTTYGTTRRRKVVSIIVVLVLLAITGVGAFFFFNKDDQKSARHNKKNITLVKRGPANLTVQATGIIKPIREVKLSPKQTGLLIKLHVKQGDQVKTGQVIAEMDPSNILGEVDSARGAYQASLSNVRKLEGGNRPQEVAAAKFQELRSKRAVRQAKENINRLSAQVEALGAQLKRDEAFAKRQELLSKAGAVSEQAHIDADTAASITRSQLRAAGREQEQAEQAAAQSEAELQAVQEQASLMSSGFRKEDIEVARHNATQAKGQLRRYEALLFDTKVRAPFDGVVTQKYADAGAIVTPTTSAATTSATSSSIISLSGKLELVAQVAESNVPKISIGQPVEITATAYPDKIFKGKVTQIAPAAIVTQNVTTFEVHADLTDDKKNQLLSGMNVSSQFVIGTIDDALTIPTVCVVTRRGKTGVYVPGEDKNDPEFVPVKTGQTLGSEVVILKGLKEGDEVFEGLSKEQLSKEGYDGKRGGGPGGLMGGGGGRGGGGMGRGFR